MKKILFLLLISVVIISCDLSSPEDVNKSEIKNIFDEIKTVFNFNDLDAIMQNYHPEFKHNTNDWAFEEIVWNIRLNDYDVIDFSDLQIDLHGDYATVYFTMYLDAEAFQEPSTENGDISYFYWDTNRWYLCGNEFSDLF